MNNENIVTNKSNIKGIFLVITSTFLWAINGNIGSYLFKYKGITPDHLTMFRLVFAGIILLVYEYFTNKRQIFSIFKVKSDLVRLLFFAFLGLLLMQYSYFYAVKHSNAGTATILQSLAPFIIVIITSIFKKRLPSRNIVFSLIFALIGVFLLITHGKFDQLAITTFALIFGLLSAIGCVYYNLSAVKLQRYYDTILIIGWAMFIAGIGFAITFRPLEVPIIFSGSTILGIIYVVMFGTLFPFLFYLTGSKIIGPQRASILSLVEPVASTVISVLFMGEVFIGVDYIGIALVIFALFLLTRPEDHKEKHKEENQIIDSNGN